MVNNCNILEDLKVLEQDLAARQDLKKALEDLKVNFNSTNTSAQINTPSRRGIKITPAEPKFHPNFPTAIEVVSTSADNEFLSPDSVDFLDEQKKRGIYNFDVNFNIVSGNLNCYPVWDDAAGEYTNGVENNIAFNLEQITTLYSFGTTIVPYQGYYFEDPIVDEFYADPDNPKWLTWYWNGQPFDENRHKFNSIEVRGRLSCDVHTGLVSGKISTHHMIDSIGVQIEVILKISNGNGTTEKPFRIFLSPKRGLSGFLDQENLLIKPTI